MFGAVQIVFPVCNEVRGVGYAPHGAVANQAHENSCTTKASGIYFPKAHGQVKLIGPPERRRHTPSWRRWRSGKATWVWEFGHIPLATTRRTHSMKIFWHFCLYHCFVLPGGFRGCPTRWNYLFSTIQPFSRRDSQLPPPSASFLVLRVVHALCVLRVSVRCL